MTCGYINTNAKNAEAKSLEYTKHAMGIKKSDILYLSVSNAETKFVKTFNYFLYPLVGVNPTEGDLLSPLKWRAS